MEEGTHMLEKATGMQVWTHGGSANTLSLLHVVVVVALFARSACGCLLVVAGFSVTTGSRSVETSWSVTYIFTDAQAGESWRVQRQQ
jgi:hypothetical protein